MWVSLLLGFGVLDMKKLIIAWSCLVVRAQPITCVVSSKMTPFSPFQCHNRLLSLRNLYLQAISHSLLSFFFFSLKHSQAKGVE